MRRLATGTLRFRIAFVFFLAALAVSGAVAASTYALARTFLTRQRTDVAIRQSFNGIRFANEYLSRPGSDRALDQLVTFLQARGTADVLILGGERPVSSSVSITELSIRDDLRQAVAGSGVGYVTFEPESGPRRLTFGSPIPNSTLEAYFVYPLDDLDATLAVLNRILIAVVGGAVVIAGAVGFRLADRTIQPLRRASEAAQRVAEGSLETRLEAMGTDELGLLAQSFNTMAEALEERIARERRFVADASHELRTPLTALKTSVDFLADRVTELPPRLRSAVDLAADEVRSLQHLIDDLLELSRVEAGGVQVSWEDVDLLHFCNEVVRRRAPGVDIRVSAPEGLVLRTDKSRLERVVGNLVENALIHGRGRDVSLTVERFDEAARIVVSDRGPGIPDEHRDRIFERFWRADVARGRSGGSGAGLGLAIARETATVIGAELLLVNVPQGARFEVEVPLRGEPDPEGGG